MRKWFSFCIGLLLFGAAAAEEKLFAEFGELEAPVLFPKGAPVTIDAHGNYCLDGRPRFLLGAQVPNKIVGSMAPTQGYPDSLKWLYEQVIDYEAAQRVGFDTLSFFASEKWVKEIDGGYESFLFDDETRDALDRLRREIGLPLQVDFTCAPWSHGLFLAAKEKYKDQIPLSAYNSRGSMSDSNHWTPYCLADPAGRELYRKMWRSGAQELKASGGRALMYELFNEPAYHDPCPANRSRFVAYLREKFKTVDAVNRCWGSSYATLEEIGEFRDRTDQPGLYVEWSKFMEREFLNLCREGMEIIRSIDPEARFCIQPPGADNYRTLPKNHVNLFEINKFCATVSTSTGGGISFGRGLLRKSDALIDTPMPEPAFREDLLQRRFFRAIADGKPVHDGETYTKQDYASLHGTLWLQLVRGGNAGYLFLWCKRAWDPRWTPPGSPEGGRRLAELMQFHILNPWAFPTEGLKAIMDVKKEMLALDDLFVPRQNYRRPEIGLLLSYPTERRAPAIGNTVKNEVRDTATVLDFLHYPYGVLLEEQTERFTPERFPVLIASGIRNIYPGTEALLRRYVNDGGILIASLEALPEDEYGRKLEWRGIFDSLKTEPVKAGSPQTLEFRIPASVRIPGAVRVRDFAAITAGKEWRVLASAGGRPAIVERDCGKGKVIFIGVQSLDYHLAAIYDALLSSAGRRPMAELSAPGGNELVPNVELHQVNHDSLTGCFAFNLDRYPKLAELKLPAGEAAIDPLTRELLPVTSGRALVYLPPRFRALVVTGSEAALRKRFPGAKRIGAGTLEARRAEADKQLESERKPPEAEFRHSPDSRFTRILDLRKFCNRPFTDSVAGDGRGGWTDQGAENSLDGVPWGIQEFCGVPTEILRFDETENRTCIVLDSRNLAPGFGAKEVRGIPLGGRLKNLYFFHCTAWTDDKEAYRFIVRYDDGSSLAVPVVCRKQVGDWWLGVTPHAGTEFRPAFRNTLGRGFHIWKWENPAPEKNAVAMDIVSAGGASIPVIVGITAEFVDPAAARNTRLSCEGWTGYGWFGCKAKWSAGTLEVGLDEQKKDWCGFNLALPETVKLDTRKIDPAAAFLSFRINGSDDAWGRHTGGQSLQVSLAGIRSGADFRSAQARIGGFLTAGDSGIDGDPATFQEVRIPLVKFFPDGMPEQIKNISFQFTGIAPAAGVKIRELALELPAEAVLRQAPPEEFRFEEWGTSGFLGCRGVWSGGRLQIQLNGKAKQNWCGLSLRAPENRPAGLEGADPALSFLRFRINGGPSGGQKLQAAFSGEGMESQKVWIADYLPGKKIDGDSATFQEVRIPLRKFFPEKLPAELRRLVIQFIDVPPAEGVEISELVLEVQK